MTDAAYCTDEERGQPFFFDAVGRRPAAKYIFIVNCIVLASKIFHGLASFSGRTVYS